MVHNPTPHVEVDAASPNGRVLPAAARAAHLIGRANEELANRCASAFELPIAVLIEQRDRLAREHEILHDKAAAERQALVDEQDRFIADLMAEHEQQVASLRQELTAAREQISRQAALMVGRTGTTSPGMPAVRLPHAAAPSAMPPNVLVLELEAQTNNLQAQLEGAYRDIDDARAESARLQDQLDQAKNETSDARFEMTQQIDAARDEIFALQRQIDEANVRADDARDQGRDEAYRLTEQIAELTRDLDERREEVRRLRGRLAVLDREGRHQSVPPPGPDDVARELDDSRTEARSLRKQLIDTKRELSRKTHELEEARAAARRSPARSRSEPSFARVTGEPTSVLKGAERNEISSASVRPSGSVRPPEEPPPEGGWPSS